MTDIKRHFKTLADVEYDVNLQNGTIYIVHGGEKRGGCKKCSSLIEADYYSLNILRQNINENAVKGLNTTVSYTYRHVLGENQGVLIENISPMMKYIKETYPEVFV